jgi:DDE superfamily endonuclease
MPWSPTSSLRGSSCTKFGLKLWVQSELLGRCNFHYDHTIAPNTSDFSIGVSENGWIDNDHCKQWFNISFLPEAQAQKKLHQPILLICDGHGSHVTSDLLVLAHNNSVFIFCLPPHTTHCLQPLDVGIFGPFQTMFAGSVDEFVEKHGTGLMKAAFVSIYLDAWEAAFTQTTIRNAFWKCGMNPLNPDIFPKSSFTLSQATSTVASSHLPPSYPIDWEEWDLELAGHNTEADHSSDSESEVSTSHHQNPSMDLSTPLQSPTPSSMTIPWHISSSLSKDQLIKIALELHDQKEAAEAHAASARAHAAIVGHKYAQLQRQINMKENAPETSCKSFATTAHIMNTTQALDQILEEHLISIVEAAKKENLWCQKPENAQKGWDEKLQKLYQKCAKTVTKHFGDLDARAEKAAEWEWKTHTARETREAKAAAKELKQQGKAWEKAEKAGLAAATRGFKKASSTRKRKEPSKDVCQDKENEGANGLDIPSSLLSSPKHLCSSSPEPHISSPSCQPPQHCP